MDLRTHLALAVRTPTRSLKELGVGLCFAPAPGSLRASGRCQEPLPSRRRATMVRDRASFSCGNWYVSPKQPLTLVSAYRSGMPVRRKP
jgi:hypothetical protein